MKPECPFCLLSLDFIRQSLKPSEFIFPRTSFIFNQITTDSRQVTPGSLFVALQGDQWDGHDFIESAIFQGARGVIYQKGKPLKNSVLHALKEPSCYGFEVANPLDAYRKIAGAWRKQFQIPIVAVAGSAGKTTAKEILSAILLGKWQNVLKTHSSQNGYLGIPMTLLKMNEENEIAVIEIGIDEIGSMQQHLSLVQPTAAFLTCIGPEHLEKLIDLPTVAAEESKALTFVTQKGGLIALNLDDPWIKSYAVSLQSDLNSNPQSKKTIFFTLDPKNQDFSKNTLLGELSKDNKTLFVHGMDLDYFAFPLLLPGKHNAMNLLAAISISIGLGLTTHEILKGLDQFQGAPGRSEIYQFPESTVVICDYYNAQPKSMEAAFELLFQLAQQSTPAKKTWVCLADMLELGPMEAQFHRELADSIIRLGFDHALLLGPRMNELENEFKNRNFKGSHVHYKTHGEIVNHLKIHLRHGDFVLIKGSRGMRMEEVWKPLQAWIHSQWSSSNENSNFTS